MTSVAFEWDGYCVRCGHGVSLGDNDAPECEDDATCNECLWKEIDALRDVAAVAWAFVSEQYECDEPGCESVATTETYDHRQLCDEHRPGLGETQDAWELDHAELYRVTRAWRHHRR